MEEENKASCSACIEIEQDEKEGGSCTQHEVLGVCLTLVNLIRVYSKNIIVLSPRPVARGSYGEVYLANLFFEQVVVKALKGGAGAAQTFKQEVQMLLKLRHENVVSLRGVCLEGPEPLKYSIILKNCSNGTLYDRISRGDLKICSHQKPFDAQLGGQVFKVVKIDLELWIKKLGIATGAGHGLVYLHTKEDPLIHGDFYSTNLMFSSHDIIQIIDFGCSSYEGRKLTSPNPKWQAPEVAFRGAKTSFKSDIYSFGIVLWEILFGIHAWKDVPTIKVFWSLNQGMRPSVYKKLPKGVPGLEEYVGLMKRCLEEKPEDRPHMTQVVGALHNIYHLAMTKYKEKQRQTWSSTVARFRGLLGAKANKLLSCRHPSNSEPLPESPIPTASITPVISSPSTDLSLVANPSPFAGLSPFAGPSQHQMNPGSMSELQVDETVKVSQTDLPLASGDPNEVSISTFSRKETPSAAPPAKQSTPSHKPNKKQKMQGLHPEQEAVLKMKSFVEDIMSSNISLRESPRWKRAHEVVQKWDSSSSGVTYEDLDRLLKVVFGEQHTSDDSIKHDLPCHNWEALKNQIGKIMVPNLFKTLVPGIPSKLCRQCDIPKKQLEWGEPLGDHPLRCSLANTI